MLKRIFDRREKEERGHQTKRLPPGQALTQKFPVLHYGSIPRFNPETWTFKIFGDAVEQENLWTWAEFQKLPRTKVTLDIHCVTRWSKLDTDWEGISLRTLVEQEFITLKDSARYIIQHCAGDYTTNTPLGLLLSDNALLATHYNGQPLTPEHGYPLRVVIGSFADRSEENTAYFWKGGKWLRALEIRAADQLGFWERYGYHNQADPWTEQRFDRG